MVGSSREIKEEISKEKRYFLTSLEPESSKLAEIIRSHWGIENSLHWVLDINFREDDSRIREKVGALNFAAMRRTAVGILNAEKSKKISMRRKINLSQMDYSYLLKVIFGASQ